MQTSSAFLGDAVLREVRPLARLPLALANVRAVLPVDLWLVQFLHGPRNTDAVLAAPELAPWRPARCGCVGTRWTACSWTRRSTGTRTSTTRRRRASGARLDGRCCCSSSRTRCCARSRMCRSTPSPATPSPARHGPRTPTAPTRRGATTSSTASATRGCRCGGATSSRPRSQTTRRRSSWCRWC